ncbi:helix-turn-helix domain-containing protein [Planctomycetota bacterium]|nr:helix-turn-helix domain-containing protein [Planctomycetota bacterium]
MLTYREAAEYLSVSERTVWGLVKANQIQACKIGRLVRIPLTSLDEFIGRVMNQV